MGILLKVLSGKRKDEEIYPVVDFIFNGDDFADLDMSTSHAKITIDSNFSWNIKALRSSKIRLGSDELTTISLLTGLVFNLGQTAFKVIDQQTLTTDDWKEKTISYLNIVPWGIEFVEFHFFTSLLRLQFVKGVQTGQFLSLSYGPRSLGFNNLDLSLEDSTWPNQTLKFFQVAESLYVENISQKEIYLNNEALITSPLKNGDILKIGANSVKVELLD